MNKNFARNTTFAVAGVLAVLAACSYALTSRNAGQGSANPQVQVEVCADWLKGEVPLNSRGCHEFRVASAPGNGDNSVIQDLAPRTEVSPNQVAPSITLRVGVLRRSELVGPEMMVSYAVRYASGYVRGGSRDNFVSNGLLTMYAGEPASSVDVGPMTLRMTRIDSTAN